MFAIHKCSEIHFKGLIGSYSALYRDEKWICVRKTLLHAVFGLRVNSGTMAPHVQTAAQTHVVQRELSRHIANKKDIVVAVRA